MKPKKLTPINAPDATIEGTPFILFTSENHKVHVRVRLENETIWLTQKAMAELFEVDVRTISYHLLEIFKSGELPEDSVIQDFRITANDGKSYNTQHYNLDAIIAVGYRVNSKRATQFRIWATQTLKEFIIKGFVLDDERLKQGQQAFGKDYFRDLLERVQSIRASERRIYLQITDIFRECASDYDPQSDTTKNFYAHIQNKFHYAITGQTAAEIVFERANHALPHAGLTTWKHAPEGRVLASDMQVAKNYLSEAEIRKLERTINAFFDYIENQIEQRQDFTMETFAASVDKFLSFNDFKVLSGLGKISKDSAEKKAAGEYQQFNKQQKIESDFDRFIKASKNIASNKQKKQGY